MSDVLQQKAAGQAKKSEAADSQDDAEADAEGERDQND
jgi:hypothetical protein